MPCEGTARVVMCAGRGRVIARCMRKKSWIGKRRATLPPVRYHTYLPYLTLAPAPNLAKIAKKCDVIGNHVLDGV